MDYEISEYMKSEQYAKKVKEVNEKFEKLDEMFRLQKDNNEINEK